MDIDVDEIISMLLNAKKEKAGTQVNLREDWIRALCLKAQEVFRSQPMLLKLKAPTQVCGILQFSIVKRR
ncbi:MAG: hypothetical protein IJX60_04120 [Paludibacteraceae bacterium]|nr:hypothetical protein [Paludibacteraceae bacterium]